ncbi:MAG: helix-hairpin-helix domain-containing protein [Burkholderiaceae bacterium]|nr:helix-hairpin-helix domain-containing protein [Burkholderiaceae bacterium]
MRPGGVLRAIAALALGFSVAGAALALDANTATQAELETIRGVGPALSARIVEARRARPFDDLDDLKARVRGIGDANLRRMREAGLSVGPSGRVQTFTGQPAAARPKRASRARTADAARR